jgi:hypothetical protein
MTDEQRQSEKRQAELAEQRQADEQLLRRAELALTQLNNAYGLETDQSATLAAIRLRLEGKERASLEDLLTAGKDFDGPADEESDPLSQATQRATRRPSFEDALKQTEKRKKPSLDDFL